MDKRVTRTVASLLMNLQNIPEGARELFVAPEGHYIIGIDYSGLR